MGIWLRINETGGSSWEWPRERDPWNDSILIFLSVLTRASYLRFHPNLIPPRTHLKAKSLVDGSQPVLEVCREKGQLIAESGRV